MNLYLILSCVTIVMLYGMYNLQHTQNLQTLPDSHNAPDSVCIIPTIVHMIWLVPGSQPLPVWSQVMSWKTLNPGWRVQVWNRSTAESIIQQHFPNVWSVWGQLKPVEQSDVFRYAIVWMEGGVYADIDVECLRPVQEWPGFNSSRGIVGIEGRLTSVEEMKRVNFAALLQYCQWTFAFVPKHPILQMAIDIAIQNVHMKIQNTIYKTGPGAFTKAVKQVRESGLHILEPNAFACCGGYKNSPVITDESLVRHYFRGSWK